MTIQIRVREFPTAHDAIQHTFASGRGEAILLNGKHYVAEQTEIDRLAAAGVALAYLCDHVLPDGSHRIITVPVN